MKAADRRDKLKRADWRVYAILDPRALGPESSGQGARADEIDALIETARRALRGGAGVVQLRDKASSGRRLVARGRLLQDLCDGFDALFIVNDRIDVALACGADGVHLGPEDISVEEARRIAPQLIIGASAGDAARARELAGQGADYLGVGAIYDAQPSKADASAPRGPRVLAEVAAAVDIPIVGIGGVSAQNASEVVAHGAAGVAVIREIMAAADPEMAARRLLDAVEDGRSARA
jgi:thiamine-phosphate pyrophosphorylase